MICWPRAIESTGAPLTAVTISPARKPIRLISAMSLPADTRTPVRRPPSSTGTICTRLASSLRILAQTLDGLLAHRRERASFARAPARSCGSRIRGIRRRVRTRRRRVASPTSRTHDVGRREILIARELQGFLDAFVQQDHVIRIDAREFHVRRRHPRRRGRRARRARHRRSPRCPTAGSRSASVPRRIIASVVAGAPGPAAASGVLPNRCHLAIDCAGAGPWSPTPTRSGRVGERRVAARNEEPDQPGEAARPRARRAPRSSPAPRARTSGDR